MRTSGRTACATIILSIAIVSSAAGQSANEAAPTAPPATNEQSPNQAAPTPPQPAPPTAGLNSSPPSTSCRTRRSKKPLVPRNRRSPFRPLAASAVLQQALSSQSAAGQTAPTTAPVAAPVTVPSAVTNVTDTEIEQEGTGSIQQTLQAARAGHHHFRRRRQSAARGALLSRLRRIPGQRARQGIAVYQNGVRINEAFGDVVNWDVIPSNAIASMSVVSNNPAFGLNALGGAVSILMKDGFSYQGGEVDVMAGSFGRTGRRAGRWIERQRRDLCRRRVVRGGRLPRFLRQRDKALLRRPRPQGQLSPRFISA